MKVKIITCHYAYNYGAVLQTHALCSLLNESGVTTEVINYRPYYYRGSTKSKNKLKLLLRKVIRVPDNIKSEKVFYSFLKRYVPMTEEYKDYSQLEKANPEADLYIAGSDQIWNFSLPNGYDPFFYLKFVKNGGFKISYAASLSADDITDEQMTYLRDNLADFDALSVREATGKTLLEKCGLKDIKTAMDPVYLHDRSFWDAMAKKPKMSDDKYILVFAFNRQKHVFEAAKKLAKKHGYKVYSINTFWEDVFQGTDKYFWNCIPEEFLYLIKHAQCVVTNSFHGLSFSLLFNRPVVLFEKDDKGNSRMTDLLTTLDLKDEILAKPGDEINIPKLDFDTINSRIEQKRQQSREFLNDCISKADL